MKIGKHKITRDDLIVFFTALVVLTVAYQLTSPKPLMPYQHRGLFLAFFFIVVAIVNWPKSKTGQVTMAIALLLSIFGPLWLMYNQDALYANWNRPTEIELIIYPIFLVGFCTLVVLVGGVGRILLVFALIIICYLHFGHLIPGTWGHPPFSDTFIGNTIYTDLDIGITGAITEVGARLIAPFILFATLLMVAGLGELFMALATWLAGNMTGGPAKVSVFSSAAYGMLSGSAIADVAATGSFTIPTMKGVGYEPEQAATVETLASTGAMLMPPIMGLAAFLMSDITGIPYLQICVTALVPAFLWYYTVTLIVHFYALRHRAVIKKWRPPREEFMRVVKEKWHLSLAIPALVGGLVYFAAAEQGAFWAIVFLIVLCNIRRNTRLTVGKLRAWMLTYARMYAPIAILVVVLTIFVGGLQGSGLHTRITNLILGEVEAWWLILLISFVLVILMGMAINASATYLASVAILAGALAPHAVHTLVWHFFIMQSAALAPITPPTALAAYTAARIAGTDMLKTAARAAISALPLFLVPMACFKKALFIGMVGTPLPDVAQGVATLCLGILVFTCAREGYFFRDLSRQERALGMIVGIAAAQPFYPPAETAGIGAGILLLTFWFVSGFLQKREASKIKT